MSELQEVKNMIESQGAALEAFVKRNDARIKSLETALDQELAKRQRPSDGGGAPINAPAAQWYDAKSKRLVPVLARGDNLFTPSTEIKDAPNVGRVLRGLVMGGRADDAKDLAEERKALEMVEDPSGGYTVRGALSSTWIDLLRAQMVLAQAGAMTVPMDTAQLSIARVTGDPEVVWHRENATIENADPTFGAVTLNAKTVLTVVRMSLELSQDSANIESILTNTLTQAIAGAIDSAGLVGVSTGAGAAPGGVFNLSGRNTVTGVGAPTTWDYVVDAMYELMADNVPMSEIGALVAHPAVWKKMRKLKTGISSDNTPLPMPEEIAKLPKLWTTAAPLTSGTTAKAALAKWSDLLFGVRKDIQVRVLQEAFMGSNLQVAILAYARVDFAAARAASFATMEGITV